MKRSLYALTALFSAIMALPIAANAVGTAAGTAINNTASVTFTIGAAAPTTLNSNTSTTTVVQITDVTVSAQNSPKTVQPAATGEAILYKVTNTGNGADTFALTGNSTILGDSFDPTVTGLYTDVNNNGVYDAGTDTPISAVTLAADSYAMVLVVNTIPSAATVSDGYTGLTNLAVSSNTANSVANGPTGTVVAGAGVGGVNAVVGPNSTANADGTYQVSSIVVSIVKTSSVSDPYGGTAPFPGATITYTITVSAAGTGTANTVAITDAIPTNTTYIPGSMSLSVNGGAATALTDASDAPSDYADYNVTNTGKVTLGFTSLTQASGSQAFSFQVRIN